MSAPTQSAGRLRRLGCALTPAEWRRAAAFAGAVAALHVLGFVILLVLVAPRHLALGGAGAFTVGVGITAYTLGLRHAFDADHIAAIDNTTRKLMAEGKRPLGVGFFFSLGHSTIVFALSLLLAVGIRTLAGQVEHGASTLQTTTGLIGTLVSGGFLALIGVLNLILLRGIIGVSRRVRDGELDEAELERHLQARGLLNRIYGRFGRTIRHSWQMYPLGMLFGLGFDTATEIALLTLAAGTAFSGLPFYAILCLPILFAAGMSLLDTLDGAFMNFAYGWAFAKPVRKLYYNITITGLSVAVALVIGAIELLSVVGDRLNLDGGFWRWIAAVNLNSVGYVVVALFALTWLVAAAVWRLGRIEERWSARGS